MRRTILVGATLCVGVTACGLNSQQKGTLAGIAGGAAAGAAVSKGSVWATLLGAALGGTAGNYIGRKMDEHAKELKQAVPSAEVARVGEGINVTFESGLMFKLNSAEIDEGYKRDIAAAAEVFRKYPDTNILIEGHTDSTGTDAINLALSQKRAEAVEAFLKAQGIDASRLTAKWYGSAQPKFANDTEANRQKNRRVELAVYANDAMKAAARQAGAAGGAQ